MKKFVLYLQKLNSSEGQPKYPLLISLFKVLLSVSHGNSASENGFSINKAMLNVHGYSLGESTSEALPFIKDAIYCILLYLTFSSQGLCLKLSDIQGNSIWLTWKLCKALKGRRKQRKRS